MTIPDDSPNFKLNQLLNLSYSSFPPNLQKWIDEKSSYEEKHRDFCRSCTTEQEEQIITFYLEQSDKAKTLELIGSIMAQLNQIADWFNKYNVDLFEFIGSSIFFIYSFSAGQLDCRLKLIDFAHIFPLQGSSINLSDDMKDHNYLLGLNSLMKLIKKVTKMTDQ